MHTHISSQVNHDVDPMDPKYITGLSTVLVATIQETKDRISQIEYIFCSQLYPNFLSSYSEAKRAAEDKWKDKESNLQSQLDRLNLEKEEALRSLEVFKSKFAKRMKDRGDLIWQKAKEIAEVCDSRDMLLKLVESKSSVLADKEKQLKEHEKKISSLLAQLGSLEGKFSVIVEELQETKKEITKGKEVHEELWRQINSQVEKLAVREKILTDSEHESKQLAVQIEKMETHFHDLKQELRRKTIELEERNYLQEQMVQQVNLKDQQLREHEKEKILLLSRLNELENDVEELHKKLKRMNVIEPERSKDNDDLAQCLELKASQLLLEKQKRKDLILAYKKLKSQYTFLCSKFGLTTENMISETKIRVQMDASRIQNGASSPELSSSPTCRQPLIPILLPKVEPAPADAFLHPTDLSDVVDAETSKIKGEINSQDITNEKENIGLNQDASSNSSPTSVHPAASWKTSRSIGSSSGTKRRASDWRDTRPRQSPGGPDPHDDFLDTPYENIRENLNKRNREEKQEKMNCDSADDETQDLNAVSGCQKQEAQAPRVGGSGFKYVEPVRKKADRENLKGVECKQCKKFYDAVLADGRGKDTEENFRCEHHEGVSRHRYKYVPPSTPEGFWNIGFDSEN